MLVMFVRCDLCGATCKAEVTSGKKKDAVADLKGKGWTIHHHDDGLKFPARCPTCRHRGARARRRELERSET